MQEILITLRCIWSRACSKILLFTLAVLFLVRPCQADAIGQWVDGKVTHKPWKSTYTYIKVGDTRYTVMENVVVRQVYKKNGAEYKKYIPLKQIRTGNEVLMLVEGNRVYQIEKLQL